MSMRNKVNLNPYCRYDRPYDATEEEEEGFSYSQETCGGENGYGQWGGT